MTGSMCLVIAQWSLAHLAINSSRIYSRHMTGCVASCRHESVVLLADNQSIASPLSRIKTVHYLSMNWMTSFQHRLVILGHRRVSPTPLSRMTLAKSLCKVG
jgi:hypothetical protein